VPSATRIFKKNQPCGQNGVKKRRKKKPYTNAITEFSNHPKKKGKHWGKKKGKFRRGGEKDHFLQGSVFEKKSKANGINIYEREWNSLRVGRDG